MFSFLSGSQEGKFNISSREGVVTLVQPLDYETTTNYTLEIQASDSGQVENRRHTYFALNINVLDVNDNSPQFSQDVFYVNVFETLTIGECLFLLFFVCFVFWQLYSS